MVSHKQVPFNATRFEQPTADDLRELDLFRNLRSSTLELLSKDSKIYDIDVNERVETTRGETNYLYVIVEGYVTAWRPSCFDSREEYFLAWRGPNQVIGEMRAIGTESNSTRFQTCDPCRLLEISSDAFVYAADNDPVIYRNLSILLMKKMRYQSHRAEVVQMPNPRRKVAQTLLHLAEDRCGQEMFEKCEHLHIPGVLNQTEIGLYAHVDRATVNRQLGKLKKEQLIDFNGSKSGTKITIQRKSDLQKITQTTRITPVRNNRLRKQNATRP